MTKQKLSCHDKSLLNKFTRTEAKLTIWILFCLGLVFLKRLQLNFVLRNSPKCKNTFSAKMDFPIMLKF